MNTRRPGPPDADPRGTADARRAEQVMFGLAVLALIAGLALLAALVPLGHGFVPKGGAGLFKAKVVGGAFTLHPLLVAVPTAACFVLGLADWRHPWRLEHLDLLALTGFFPAAMLLSDDLSQAGLWLAAACLGWLFVRLIGASFGWWRMPELRPSMSSRWVFSAIRILVVARLWSVAAGNILDVGQASSLGAWRLLHGLNIYGAHFWRGPRGLRLNRPDSYGPFAYYAYIPFVAVLPTAPATIATLLPAACFDVLTIAGLHRLGRQLGGRPLARAFTYAYLLYAFADLPLMTETNDALIAALCVWVIVAVGRPALRGFLIAAAALTKFVPGILAFQFVGVTRGRSRYVLALLASVAAMLAWPLVTSGLRQSVDSTFGYQMVRRGGGVQFSIWTDMPHATLARAPLAAALLLLAVSPMWRPPMENARDHAAFAAALLIGAQLLLGYWFYTYIIWFYPLLLVAVVHPAREHPDPEALTAVPGEAAAGGGGMNARGDGELSHGVRPAPWPTSLNGSTG